MKSFILDLLDRSAEVKAKRFDWIDLFSTSIVILTPFLTLFEQISIFVNETIGNKGVYLGAIFIFFGFYLAIAVIRRKEKNVEILEYKYPQNQRIIAKISLGILLVLSSFYMSFTYQHISPLSNVIDGYLICSNNNLPAVSYRVDILDKKGNSVLPEQFYVTDENGYFSIFSQTSIKRSYFLHFEGINGDHKSFSLKNYDQYAVEKNNNDINPEKAFYLPICY